MSDIERCILQNQIRIMQMLYALGARDGMSRSKQGPNNTLSKLRKRVKRSVKLERLLAESINSSAERKDE